MFKLSPWAIQAEFLLMWVKRQCFLAVETCRSIESQSRNLKLERSNPKMSKSAQRWTIGLVFSIVGLMSIWTTFYFESNSTTKDAVVLRYFLSMGLKVD